MIGARQVDGTHVRNSGPPRKPPATSVRGQKLTLAPLPRPLAAVRHAKPSFGAEGGEPAFAGGRRNSDIAPRAVLPSVNNQPAGQDPEAAVPPHRPGSGPRRAIRKGARADEVLGSAYRLANGGRPWTIGAIRVAAVSPLAGAV